MTTLLGLAVEGWTMLNSQDEIFSFNVSRNESSPIYRLTMKASPEEGIEVAEQSKRTLNSTWEEVTYCVHCLPRVSYRYNVLPQEIIDARTSRGRVVSACEFHMDQALWHWGDR